jgi:hypothetical protein
VPIVKGTVVFLVRFFGLAAGTIATLASLHVIALPVPQPTASNPRLSYHF